MAVRTFIVSIIVLSSSHSVSIDSLGEMKSGVTYQLASEYQGSLITRDYQGRALYKLNTDIKAGMISFTHAVRIKDTINLCKEDTSNRLTGMATYLKYEIDTKSLPGCRSEEDLVRVMKRPPDPTGSFEAYEIFDNDDRKIFVYPLTWCVVWCESSSLHFLAISAQCDSKDKELYSLRIGESILKVVTK